MAVSLIRDVAILLQDDEDKKVVDKRKTGLFHVFRERLSKGEAGFVPSHFI